MLVSYRAKQGVEGSRNVSFPFATLERRPVLPPGDRPPGDPAGEDDGADKVGLTGRLVEVEAEIEKVKTRLQCGTPTPWRTCWNGTRPRGRRWLSN